MSHINEELDFVVNVYIVRGDKVLLRMHDKYFKWLPVGGHIELGEDPIEASLREVEEECGLEVKLLPLNLIETKEDLEVLPTPFFTTKREADPGHVHVVFGYVATTAEEEIKPGTSEKQTEFKWFSKEELEEDSDGVPDAIRKFALRALELSEYTNS